MEVYEEKIIGLKRQLDCLTEGFRAVKRVQEYDIKEVKRLVKLVMDEMAEVNRLDECVYKLVEENYEKEMVFAALNPRVEKTIAR